ncbi:hypothetical protein [Alteribacillus sp. HJP-4]|uniref:hypothetical protein n=1 Tax=Alteribacillus sp. HJP-4 TaxID=2775394 RepID=UPI0035CCDA34
MKIWISALLVLLILFAPGAALQAQGAELEEIFVFKATVETRNDTLHWEYNSPSAYEFHQGDTAFHDERAVKEVKEIYEKLQPEKGVSKEELAARLLKNGYADLERLDVRWQNDQGELHTWIWKKTPSS